MKFQSIIACVLASFTQAVQQQAGMTVLSQQSNERTLSSFQTKFFWKRPGEGFYEVNVGLPSEDVRLMAMADLDNDKLTDLVTLDSTGQTVTVRYFVPSTNKYSRIVDFSPAAKGEVVSSILVTKSRTTMQGLIAVVQESKKNGATTLKQYTSKAVYSPMQENQTDSEETGLGKFFKNTMGTPKNKKKNLQEVRSEFTLETDSDLATLNLQPGSQPMLLDVDGDGYMDILFQGLNNTIQVALGTEVPTIFKTVDFFTSFLDKSCEAPSSLTDLISSPNSNAFVDFDGDCRQDMFLTRTDGTNIYYEIYIQTTVNNEPKYCLTTKREFGLGLSKTSQLIEIVDFNRDGMMDLVYPRIKTGKNGGAEVLVMLNRLTAKDTKSKSLCNSKPTKNKALFSSEPALGAVSANDFYLVSKVDTSALSTNNNVMLANSFGDLVPGRLRLSDFEMDGFPDIVMTLQNTGSSKGTLTFAFSNQLQEQGGAATKRSLNVSPQFHKAIEEAAGTNANFVSFLDLDEDGRLDFLIQKTDPSTGIPYVVALYNNMYLDNFYLKALMLNSQQTKSDNIYGNAVVGPSYRFVITDLDDRQHVVLGSQGYQQTYMALQMPYAFMGIGRSNNYVELFYAASSVSSALGSQMWTPIIPNSQLIVFAGGSQVTQSQISISEGTVKQEVINTKNWALELFMSPTQSLFLIVVSCGACLFCLAIAILILHCQEKADDAKKREQHFDYF